MLRREETPLTPDKIRYAISQIHSIHFRDEVTGKQGIMDSMISEDGKAIYRALGLPLEPETVPV